MQNGQNLSEVAARYQSRKKALKKTVSEKKERCLFTHIMACALIVAAIGLNGIIDITAAVLSGTGLLFGLLWIGAAWGREDQLIEEITKGSMSKKEFKKLLKENYFEKHVDLTSKKLENENFYDLGMINPKVHYGKVEEQVQTQNKYSPVNEDLIVKQKNKKVKNK